MNKILSLSSCKNCRAPIVLLNGMGWLHEIKSNCGNAEPYKGEEDIRVLIRQHFSRSAEKLVIGDIKWAFIHEKVAEDLVTKLLGLNNGDNRQG